MGTPRASIASSERRARGIHAAWLLLAASCGAPTSAPAPVVSGPSAASREAAAPGHAAASEDTTPSEESPAPETATPALPPADPSLPEVSLTLACGRLTARIPGGWSVTADTQPCIDPGYPFDLDAVGVAGGTSTHVVERAGCQLEIDAREDARAASIVGARAEAPRPDAIPTPEGTSIAIGVRPYPASPPAGCEEEAERIEEAVRQSASVTPLRDAVTATRADISTSGHAIELEVPAGYWLVSNGGAADEYETGYVLRGPGRARAELFTSWLDAGEDFDRARFVPHVLTSRTRLRATEYDPLADDDESEGECRTGASPGPEPRLSVELYVCGTRAEQAALERILRAARFTPPTR